MCVFLLHRSHTHSHKLKEVSRCVLRIPAGRKSVPEGAALTSAVCLEKDINVLHYMYLYTQIPLHTTTHDPTPTAHKKLLPVNCKQKFRFITSVIILHISGQSEWMSNNEELGVCDVYPSCLSWTPIAVDQSFFPLALTERNKWLSFFSEMLSLHLPFSSYTKWALRLLTSIATLFNVVDLPLNNKLAPLRMSKLRPWAQNPGCDFP